MTEFDRREVSFSQAEGLEPLPQPLALGEVSEEARALIWLVLASSISATAYLSDEWGYKNCLGIDWQIIERDRWVRKLFKPVDEFVPTVDRNIPIIKMIVFNWEIRHLFDFLTFVIRHSSCPEDLDGDLSYAFEESRLAYRIADRTIWPAASPEEGKTIARAFADLSSVEYGGARSHLREAGRLITGGEWASSVRESIHAVESVAKIIEPSAKTLSDSLVKLEKGGRLNPNLKRGLNALYDFTSDEKGVRHARVFEEKSNVDEADALYMFGACASFVSYLIARASIAPQ